jgi:aryl-alcohol dehydrogenase-like predicted oxidoreductase
MSNPLTRREFLETAALGAAVTSLIPATASAAAPLPKRRFGRSNLQVSILAFGCGSRFLMYPDEQVAVGVLSNAIDQGITYVDTAVGYGNGESERRVGLLMKTRRNDVVLATKIPESARDRDSALRVVEASFKRLQTDHLDVLHVHSLTDEADLARIQSPTGVLKALHELRDQKVTRCIGMTSHTDGRVMARAIAESDLDCVQMAMNPARANHFEELALPQAVKKDLGIVCMKVTAQEQLVGSGPGRAAIEPLLRYALSLPVSAAVVGMPKPEFISENIALARAFQPLTPEEQEKVRQQVAPAQAAVAAYFGDHADA